MINMGSYDKMLERIMKTPTVKDIMPNELQVFLEHFGFQLKRVRGDHFIYQDPTSEKTFMLNIPMHKPVKPAYIDQIRETILEIKGE